MAAPTKKTAASKAAMNNAGPTAREISHRQRKKFPGQEIENGRIEAYGRKGQQIFLRKRGELHEDERREHAKEDYLQKADVVFDNDFVDNHLCKHGEE